MTADRIHLHMTGMEVIKALAEKEVGAGFNPGAATVLIEIIKEAKGIDPDAVLEWAAPCLALDSLRIYGSDIWLLYKDICGQSIEKMMAVLRAVQLGLARREEVLNAIAACSPSGRADQFMKPERVDELFAAVRQKLPRFAANVLQRETTDGD